MPKSKLGQGGQSESKEEEEKVEQLGQEEESEEGESGGEEENAMVRDGKREEEEDSDMEEYRGGAKQEEEVEEEVEDEVEEEVPEEETPEEEMRSESEYKVTEIQIEDDSKKRLSMGLEDCFSDRSEEPKKKESAKNTETLVNYASVKNTIKQKQREKESSQSVERAAKEIESKISHIPPRYTPAQVGSSSSSSKMKKQTAEQAKKPPIKKKPRVPTFKKTRKSSISDILPKPIGGGQYSADAAPQTIYKRPQTGQERKIEREKKAQQDYLLKTQKLNQDLKGVLQKPKVEHQEFKQMLHKAETHLDKGRVMEQKRRLEIEAAKQREVKELLIQQQKQERKQYLRPQSAKVEKTRIVEKEGKYTHDVSKLTTAQDYLDIALKEKRRKQHAVSVRAIKAVTAVEEVAKATRRHKSSLSPLYMVLQQRGEKREDDVTKRIVAQLKEKQARKMEERKKYQRPRFAVEMERKKKKQMEELRQMARQKLRELKVKSQIRDEDDALDVLERVTRAAKREEKKDALPEGASEVHDQEALLEQILELKKTLNLKLKTQKKEERELRAQEIEAEELERKMRTLASNKALVDVGTKRFEKIQPRLDLEQRKRSIITTESPLKSKRNSEEEITAVQKLAFFLEKQRLSGNDAFGLMDANGDGVLTLSEIIEGLVSRLGVPLRGADLDSLMREIDTDGDGVLTKHEFTSALENEAGALKRGSRRVAKDVDVERPLEIEEMLLDMKVKIKYMKERLPELKKQNSFQDPELRIKAKQILQLQKEIQNQRNKFAAQKKALLLKIATSSSRPELIDRLLQLRALAQEKSEEQRRKISRLEREHADLKHESSQLMQINLLLKGQKSELKDELRFLQIKHKMSRELNINFTRELRGFVQRSELDFKQLYDIQEKQIIEVDYKKEEEYRRKAGEFLVEAYTSQRCMAVNTLKGLRAKAALFTLKDYYHEKWEMKRNKAERLLRAISFLALKGVQLREKSEQQKRVRERERRKIEHSEKKNTPEYKAAELIATTWKQKQMALKLQPERVSPRKAQRVVYKQLEVMCSQCSKKADIECVECEKPFCETCYDSGHRSGFRRQHEFKKIVVRRKKKIEEEKKEEMPSLFSKPLKNYSGEEFLREFELILKDLHMDIQEIIISKIDKEEMEQEGKEDIITTAQLYAAIRSTVHQLKEPEILKYINLVYKECSWHPQKDQQWRYYIDCKKLFSVK